MKINDYSYKPEPQFFGNADYYFGWEWELASSRGLSIKELEYILEPLNTNLYYVKKDCSVDFEVVFHPMSAEFFRDLLDGALRTAMIRAMIKCDDMSRCGSHLHISRTAIADENVGKIAIVVRDYIAHNGAKSVDRTEWELQRWADPNSFGRTRYEAVNNCNRSTVEFRLFGGTNNPLKIKRNIALIQEWLRAAAEPAAEDWPSEIEEDWKPATSREAPAEWGQRLFCTNTYEWRGYLEAERFAIKYGATIDGREGHRYNSALDLLATARHPLIDESVPLIVDDDVDDFWYDVFDVSPVLTTNAGFVLAVLFGTNNRTSRFVPDAIHEEINHKVSEFVRRIAEIRN